MDFSEFFKRAGRIASANSPAILTGIGVAGTFLTAYLVGKATVKATRIIDERENEIVDHVDAGRMTNLDAQKVFNTKEKILFVWKLYIPAAAVATATATAIVFANRVSSHRTVVLTSAYAIADRAYTEYRAKVEENFGEKKARSVVDSIAQDKVRNTPIDKSQIIVMGKGNHLCLDGYTGRPFYSDWETIRGSINDLNLELTKNGFVSLSDFYYHIGLPPTSVSDDLGWRLEDGLMDVTISSTLTVDNDPCILVNFRVRPKENYFRTD